MKIAVAGVGYVGLSVAVLLARHHSVKTLNLNPAKAARINARQSPIADADVERCFREERLDLLACTDAAQAFADADWIIIAVPTNYDSEKNCFDTSAVDDVLEITASIRPEAAVVMKSTVPVGYTETIREKFHCDRILHRGIHSSSKRTSRLRLRFYTNDLKPALLCYRAFDNQRPIQVLTALRSKLELMLLQDRHDRIHNFCRNFRRGALADVCSDDLA